MQDIFNHLAVFGVLFVSISVSHFIRYKEDAFEYPIESFFCWMTASLCVFIAGEAIAWSIYYLSGAGV